MAGTFGYMSPEQVRGQAVDARSDIFAFGAVEVHRDPDPATGAYRARVVVSSEGTLAATSVPGLRIDVADLLR